MIIAELREKTHFRFLALLLVIMIIEPLWAAGTGSGSGIEEEGSGWELPPGAMPLPHTDEKKTESKTEPKIDWETEEAGLGQGYVAVEVDSLPAVVYLDGQKLSIESCGYLLPVRQGRHFLSLFPADKVLLAFRDEVPASFWERLRPVYSLPDRTGLMAAYERGPVQAGTVWLSVSPDDTSRVRLSRAQVSRSYRQESVAAVVTFFSVTTVIGAAMIASVAAISRER
ncbi:MAG: hypothetical protein ABIK44_07635 [candidate division WOR-3 bacterium]